MSKQMNFSTIPMNEVPVCALAPGKNEYCPLILVVNDDCAIADTLAEILTQSGYAGVPAYNGQEALETALLMPPDALIADAMLPGISGLDLAIAVEGIYPECKIMLLSGSASTAALIASANRAGHHLELINKPMRPKDMLAHVNDSLKDRGSQIGVCAN